MTKNKDLTLEPETFKVVLLGDIGVGKTCIINRYIQNKYIKDPFTTTGGNFFTKMIQYPKYNQLVKLDIWDTAGQEKYRSINKIYYQKCHGAILVYDITRKSSLKELTAFYNDLINVEDKNKILLTVVGNKNDSYMQEQVSDLEGKEFAQKLNASFKLTSALNAFGIIDLFENMGIELLKKRKLIEITNESSVPINLTKPKEEGNEERNECSC